MVISLLEISLRLVLLHNKLFQDPLREYQYEEKRTLQVGFQE